MSGIVCLNLFNIRPFQLYSLHRCNGKTSSTRIRRRTCHSQIATHDEIDREDAFGCVFFNFIKPGEDLVWKTRSWKICCKWRSIGETWETVTTRLFKRGLWSIVVFSRVEKWSCGARSIMETWENFLGYIAKSCPSSWGTFSRRKCAFRKVRRYDSRWIGETWDSESPRRGKFQKFRHGQWRSRICEQSQRPSAKQTKKNVERCRVRWRAFNNMVNIHGCEVKCGDIHGKEFLNYSKFRQELWRSHVETNVRCHCAVGE